MVIDTSALVAILFKEPEREAFERAIHGARLRLVSAMTKLEMGMVLVGRHGPDGGAQIVPFDDHQAAIALNAFTRYGKGRHKAALNFGDCAAYALAMSEAEPLLFKGTDFGATDVEVVRV
jgi:ribonuclease VapC